MSAKLSWYPCGARSQSPASVSEPFLPKGAAFMALSGGHCEMARKNVRVAAYLAKALLEWHIAAPTPLAVVQDLRGGAQQHHAGVSSLIKRQLTRPTSCSTAHNGYISPSDSTALDKALATLRVQHGLLPLQWKQTLFASKSKTRFLDKSERGP